MPPGWASAFEMAVSAPVSTWYLYYNSLHSDPNWLPPIPTHHAPVKRRRTESRANTKSPEMTLLPAKRPRLITFTPHSDVSSSKPSHSPKQSVRSYRFQGSGSQSRSAPKGTSDVVVECEGPVNKLFPEILTEIFMFLDVQSKGRVAQVCSTWRDAVYRKPVWSGIEAKLHLKGGSKSGNPTLFPSLVQRGIKRVQVLSLRKSLRELVKGLPNLESLNLTGCFNLSETALNQAFSDEAPALRTLNLSLCKEVNDNSMGTIAARCKNLETLDLAGCSRVSNQGMIFISGGLHRLKRLNLRSCRQVSDSGIQTLVNNATFSQSLEELCLQDCQKLSDESLRHLSEGLPRLRSLNLSFCVSVTDTGLKSLARLRHLSDLNLRSCDNVSDIGVGFLAETGASALRSLDVSFCPNVTNTGMKHIAVGLRGLESLSMSNCLISDEGLEKVAKNVGGLRVLNIGQCSGVTDRSILVVARELRHLRKIDLYGCQRVTEVGMRGLKEHLKLDLNLLLHWPKN